MAGLGVRSVFFAAAAFAVIVVACTMESSDESVEEAWEPIIGGDKCTAADGHKAVIHQDNGCSGTIIYADDAAKEACVLTAAHCCESAKPKKVTVGIDHTNPDVTYDVLATPAPKSHPKFKKDSASDGYDFCVLKINTKDKAAPPVIPAASDATKDGVKAGDNMTLVGYGMTVEPQSTNTERHHLTKAVSGLMIPPLMPVIFTSQAEKAFCGGDSGGPAIIGDKVVGVISLFYGDSKCVSDKSIGQLGRVAYVYNDFIKPYCEGGGGTTSSSGSTTGDPVTSSSGVGGSSSSSGVGGYSSSSSSGSSSSSSGGLGGGSSSSGGLGGIGAGSSSSSGGLGGIGGGSSSSSGVGTGGISYDAGIGSGGYYDAGTGSYYDAGLGTGGYYDAGIGSGGYYDAGPGSGGGWMDAGADAGVGGAGGDPVDTCDAEGAALMCTCVVLP